MTAVRGQKVVVVGLGRSGYAASKLLKAKGARVLATDLKEERALGPLVPELRSLGIEVKAGGYERSLFEEASLVVLSPGVDPHQEVFEDLIKGGVEVIGELELASRFLLGEPIIAITGTNGKSTTTTLIGHLLEKAGKAVFVGGNLDRPLSEYLLEGRRAEYVVLEVSSFQLETISRFKPFISVFLNITPDHLDRHPDFDHYLRAKARIFENQGEGDFAVLNLDDCHILSLKEGIRANRVGFSHRTLKEGVWEEDGFIHWSLWGKRGRVPIEVFPMKGAHNVENAMAAVAVAVLCGLEQGQIEEGLRTYRPLAHRIEWVGEIEGVAFYDDSKATNPDATLRALDAFCRPVVLIAGGLNKGLDLKVLSQKASRLRAVVALGEAAEEIEEAFRGLVPVVRACDMGEAVREAYGLAERGDIVLLSPACASFDMFKDYKERGEAFKRAVRELQDAL